MEILVNEQNSTSGETMNVMNSLIFYLSGVLPVLAAEDISVAPWTRETDEQRLLRNLRENYDPSVRPVYDASQPVVIRLGITLTQVLDVDEKNQVMTINVWLDQEWYDEKLVWEEKTYANISRLRIPCDLIWLPDIVLYNSVDNHNKKYMRALAMVSSNGNVFWPPIVRFRSSCKMDITYFPFDDQVCKLKLGSWAYDGFQVDVTNRSMEVDLANYVDNGEWTLVDTKVIRNVIYYPCCKEPFPDVTFYIHIRRRVLYYFFNVIIPCMLLSSLSLTGFLLPPDSGEKVTLGLTVLLAFSVFMLLVAENMPPTSEYIPLIGIYLTVIMAMSAMSVALSVFVLNCHHKGTLLRRPPRCIRALAQFVGTVLCVRLNYLGKYHYEIPPRPYIHETREDMEEVRSDLPHEGHRLEPHINGVVDSGPKCRSGGQVPNGGPSSSTIASMEREIVRYLRLLMEAYEKGRNERIAVNEWQEIARVLDRFFFSLFVTITIVSTFVLLLIQPLTKTTAIADHT